MTRIAVLGAGAIGSCIGADLTQAGREVTLIDQWPEHVEALKSTGLTIEGPDVDLQVPVDAVHLCELASLVPTYDLVFLACKCYDGRWMATLIEPYLSTGGVVVATQNGVNDDAVAAAVGRHRTIGCVVELSAEIYTPGLVQRDTARSGTWLAVGELDGAMTSRLQALGSILGDVGRVDLTRNILGAKWTKLIANAMTMGPFGLLGLRNWEAAKLPGMFEVSVALGREALAVGHASGYALEPIFGLTAEEFAGSSDEVLVTAMETLVAHVGSTSTTAPVHDHRKGRRSEMAFISGVVVDKGAEVGVPTPANEAIVELDRRINSRELEMEPSNLELLRAEMAARGSSHGPGVG